MCRLPKMLPVANGSRNGTLRKTCTRENIGFIPWYPLATGSLANPGSPLSHAAARLGAAPGQVALAWLLKKSPVMLPIPGTAKVDHLESNTRAALLEIDDELLDELECGG